jgi:hypothetical protein
MSTNPARLPRMAAMGLLACLASAGAGVATAAQDGARPGEPSAVHASAGALSGGPSATYRPEAVRVFRSVDADGRVTFGDQPEPGAKAVQIRSFASSSDPQAMATAAAQQAYWREQSEAFARRRAEREEAQERAERERFDSAPSALYVIPHHLRAPRPEPIRPIGGFPVTYGTAPGLASGTPAGFIGSGFANSGR